MPTAHNAYDAAARRLVANALLYRKERGRNIRSYRISHKNMIQALAQHRLSVQVRSLYLLNDIMAEFGWVILDPDGVGRDFIIMELPNRDSITRLDLTRVKDLTQAELEALVPDPVIPTTEEEN